MKLVKKSRSKMTIKTIAKNILLNAKNIPGWHTSKKIIIIECDDWGGIRMPSKEVYDRLLSDGLNIDRSRYKYDTLESEEDLQMLFDILDGIKDSRGHSAVVSPITIMANPDFGRIKQSGFAEYHYERFTDTLLNYGRGSQVFKLWRKGLEAGIFVPEIHGRDHITVQLWLRKLREGNNDLIRAFNSGLVSLEVPGIHNAARAFRPEFYFDSEDQKPFLKRSVEEGVILFKEIFGRNPRAFVPSNGIFHPDFENDVFLSGIKFLHVNQPTTVPYENGELKYKYHITGRKNNQGLTYYTRNCAFEPTDEGYKNIELTLRQIAAAFRWGKPANISTHRVNFVGGINPENREKGLTELRKLLKAIVRNWPDAEFMSSGDALEFLRSSK